MSARPVGIARPLARLRGRAAWQAGRPLLTACERGPERGWWLEGYLEAVVVSTGGSRINAFARFPVEPGRDGAGWLAVERDALRIGRRLALHHAVLARLLGRSTNAVKIEACRLGATQARKVAA